MADNAEEQTALQQTPKAVGEGAGVRIEQHEDAIRFVQPREDKMVPESIVFPKHRLDEFKAVLEEVARDV
jgi:hypothetical protein